MSASIQPVAIEIDEANWTRSLDRAERWFHFVQTVQTSFLQLAEDTQPKMMDSHLRGYLTEIVDRARTHETKSGGVAAFDRPQA